MRTSKSRAWHMLVLFPVMFCAFAMIFYVAFMLTWPLYSITEVDFDIHSKTANPGGIILYDVHLCKHVDKFSEIHYGLREVGSPGFKDYFYAGGEIGTNPSGCMDITQHIHVPSDVPTGKYEVLVQASIDVNALRTDKYKLKVGEVEIIGAK